MKDLSLKLLKATEQFELDYKETLNKADIDEKTFNVLYDLGADIKHLMDAVIAALDEK